MNVTIKEEIDVPWVTVKEEDSINEPFGDEYINDDDNEVDLEEGEEECSMALPEGNRTGPSAAVKEENVDLSYERAVGTAVFEIKAEDNLARSGDILSIAIKEEIDLGEEFFDATVKNENESWASLMDHQHDLTSENHADSIDASTKKDSSTTERKHQCYECGKNFTKKKSLKCHVLLGHIVEGMHPLCCLCGAIFTQGQQLKDHMQKVHNWLKPFECAVCGDSFAKKRNLREHLLRFHSKSSSFSCTVCHKVMNDRKSLKIHRRTHKREKRYECNICEKTFTQDFYLEIHKQRDHNRVKLFSCSVCGDMFSTLQNVKEHKMIHSTENQYLCSVCGNKFAKNSLLQRHMIVHATPYPCSLCSEKFELKFLLRKHMVVHRKQFSCKRCSKAFASALNLQRHLQLHAQEPAS